MKNLNISMNYYMIITIYFKAMACQCRDNYGPPRCEGCKEPFIHPEEGCKNKCDLPSQANPKNALYECRNGGKCVDRRYQPTNETGQYCICSIHYGGKFCFYKKEWN